MYRNSTYSNYRLSTWRTPAEPFLPRIGNLYAFHQSSSHKTINYNASFSSQRTALKLLYHRSSQYQKTFNLSANIPYIGVDIPDISVNIPYIGVDIPDISANIPYIGVDIPDISANIPHIGVDIPDVSVNIPHIDVDISNVSADIPHIGVDIPHIGDSNSNITLSSSNTMVVMHYTIARTLPFYFSFVSKHFIETFQMNYQSKYKPVIYRFAPLQN
jgi:hypothetical protein